MKDLDPRATYVEYVYHPLVRGFIRWTKGRLQECLEGSGREWPGLAGELELLLAGEHSGPDPRDVICPAGLTGLEEIYPSRLIDHQIFQSDLRISVLLEHHGIEGVEKRLEWTVRYLNELLQTQERILARAAANRLQPPVPDYGVIDTADPGVRNRALHKLRFFSSPELDYEMADFELEMVKKYARVTPPFEEFSDNPTCFLGVYRWLKIQAEEAALTGDESWEWLLREFVNLERGVYSDQSPELIIASEDPSDFDYDQLRYFYIHALRDINHNVHLIEEKSSWGSLSPIILSHIDADISSPPAIAAWYLNADLKYLEALGTRTPQPVS